MNLIYMGGVYTTITDAFILEPLTETSWFWYILFPGKAREFNKRDVSEQLKIIYESFSVIDEDGNEIVNLQTLKSDDFMETGYYSRCLVIQDEPGGYFPNITPAYFSSYIFFMSVYNGSSKRVSINAKISSRYARAINTDGIHILDDNDFDLKGGIFLGNIDSYITDVFILEPLQKRRCFLYRLYSRKVKKFNERDFVEQFKTLYQSFSVIDEDGNEIVNLQTLRSDDFIETGYNECDLVIQDDSGEDGNN